MESIVDFENVGKSYDGASWVVDDLSLSIARGEFLTLLGPSGSGKTTTLMLLAGFEKPEKGRILVEGRDVVPLAPYKRDMGVVFQNYALFPHMTVNENIGYSLRARKTPGKEIRRKVAEALELVRLPDVGDRKPAQLSGGQQQRIALARALVYQPRLILMDEPLGALDKALRTVMQRELKELHRQLGTTFVFVTHDQDEALTMADRIAIFNEGKIVQLGTPQDLYSFPQTAFVASFLGQTNLLDATFAATDGARAVLKVDGFDGEVRATLPNDADFRPGDRVRAAIRPENIRVGQRSGAPADTWTVPAVVTDCVFHGDHLLVQTAAGGQQISVKMGRHDLVSLPSAGEAISLEIPEMHMRALV